MTISVTGLLREISEALYVRYPDAGIQVSYTMGDIIIEPLDTKEPDVIITVRAM